jgi:hypothetical protein
VGKIIFAVLVFLSINNLAYPDVNPPHKMIERAYFKCEASKNLEGGIYGKGPFKRFGPEASACSNQDWVRISHEEFKALATQWYGVNWDNEIPWWNRELINDPAQRMDSPWAKKAPYPYENKDSLLVRNSYKEKWFESSQEKNPEALQKAKQVLEEWGQNPERYEYERKQYDYKISVSESKNFISVVFLPIALNKTCQQVEIRMSKNDYVVLSILPGS